jgi:hypothetical protein
MRGRMQSAVVAGVLILGVGLSACGSDSNVSAGSATTSSDQTATTSSDQTATTKPTDTTVATTAGGSTDSSSPPDTKPVDTSFTGKGSGELCSYARDLQADDSFANALGDANSKPEDLKKSFDKVTAAISKIEDKAPAEIKDDVTTVANSFEKARALYAKYDYDMQKIIEAAQKDPSLFADLGADSEKMDAANARVTAYFEKVCGITDSSTTTG